MDPGNLPPAAAKLLQVIARQAEHGSLRSKPKGVATPPEILEACGMDAGEFYQWLEHLSEWNLIEVTGDYPFEEIRLTSTARREC